MNIQHNKLLALFCLLFLIVACNKSDSTEQISSTENPAKEEVQEELLYAWVDDLNIRSEPNTKADIVATVQPSDALVFKGEKTDKSESISLRGKKYTEPWYKITTPDKKEGWVFGGAVKREGEEKGTEKQETIELELLSYNRPMPSALDLDSGCSCSFRSKKDDYKSTILEGNYDDPPKAKAVIQLEGKYLLMKSAEYLDEKEEGKEYFYYFNDTYDLSIIAEKVGRDDGGGPQYEGTLSLTLKSGTPVSEMKVYGGCGC